MPTLFSTPGYGQWFHTVMHTSSLAGPGSVLVDLHWLCLIYVRYRAEPTLHQYVVMETGEGAREMCEAIGERWESLCYSLHIPLGEVKSHNDVITIDNRKLDFYQYVLGMSEPSSVLMKDSSNSSLLNFNADE